MAIQVTDQIKTFKAEAAMVNPYRAVKLGTNANEVNLNTGATVLSVGITQLSASIDTAVPVAVGGVAKAYVSAAVTKGDRLKAGSAGALATTTTSGDESPCYALETSTGAGVIEVMMTPGHVIA